MKNDKWIEKNAKSLSGKCVAISGATGGIGKTLCHSLASLGASLVLINRNAERTQALEEELKECYPTLAVSHVIADLEDMESVRCAASELMPLPIDYLILNAGAYSIPRRTTDIGYDNVFQINFIAPLYLARALMPKIRERGGRVVAVSSIAHNYSKIDPHDVDFSKRQRASLVYGNAKRYLTYSLLSLYGDEGLVSVAHPGITFTGITAHYPKIIFAIIKHPMKIIFMKPRVAARSIIRGIFEPTKKYEWIGPAIFDVWGNPRKKKLNTANCEEIEKINLISEEICSKIFDQSKLL